MRGRREKGETRQSIPIAISIPFSGDARESRHTFEGVSAFPGKRSTGSGREGTVVGNLQLQMIEPVPGGDQA